MTELPHIPCHCPKGFQENRAATFCSSFFVRKKRAALCGEGASGDTSMMMMPMSDYALLSAPEAKQLPLIASS